MGFMVFALRAPPSSFYAEALRALFFFALRQGKGLTPWRSYDVALRAMPSLGPGLRPLLSGIRFDGPMERVLASWIVPPHRRPCVGRGPVATP